jgi:hypothetical protein
MPTAHAAAPLNKLVRSGSEPPPVWPAAQGQVLGESFEPIYKSVPEVARKDHRIYEIMALVDAIRGGRPRDRALAEAHLRELVAPHSAAASKDESELGSEPFVADTPSRAMLARRLSTIGPGPAAFYRDGLKLLSAKPPFEASNALVSHLMREIESTLQSVLAGIAPEFPKGSHRDKIVAILSALDVPLTSKVAIDWLALTDRDGREALHRHAHRDDLGPPRSAIDLVRRWERFEGILAHVLGALERRFLTVFRRLDDLASRSSPTTQDIVTLRGAVPQSDVALQYFFGRLSSPAWIRPLAAAHYFSHPPGPVRVPDGVSFQRWPPLEYLARMSAVAPDLVAEVALAVPNSENPFVNDTLADIALALPASSAARFLDRVDGWLNRYTQILIVDKLAQLTKKLAHEGEQGAAHRMLRVLLEPRPVQGTFEVTGESRLKLDEWSVDRLARELVLIAVELGEPAFQLLCDLLREAGRLEPALVRIIRDCAERLIAADSELRPRLLEDLESRDLDPSLLDSGHDHHVGVIFGSASSIDQSALAAMSIDELVAAVGSWPWSEEPGDDPEHLSRVVGRIVEAQPDRYASQAALLRGLDVTYLRGVIDGFAAAVAAGRPFDWEPVLDLCAWIAAQPREIPGRVETMVGLDAHWGHARRAVLRLLSVGMNTERVRIPLELRTKVWSALHASLDDPDPEEGPREQRDALTLAINSVRGRAMEVAAEYAWFARSAHGGRLAPEVREALESKLSDPSDALRSIYGECIQALASLDEPWCMQHARAMFRRDSQGQDPAWETYLRYGRVTEQSFRVLDWRYRLAVDELDRASKDEREQLGPHLVVLFWNAAPDEGNSRAMIERYLESVPPRSASHALDHAGRLLVHEEPSVALANRLRALWEKRSEARRTEELLAFGRWFSSGRFDDDWSLRELRSVLAQGVMPTVHDDVLERLAELGDRHLREVMECLELLHDADLHEWGIFHKSQPVHAVLERARASQDKDMQRRAREFVGRLAARSLKHWQEYGHLVPEEKVGPG